MHPGHCVAGPSDGLRNPRQLHQRSQRISGHSSSLAAGRGRVAQSDLPAGWFCPVVTTIHALVKTPHREFAAILRRANGPS